MTMQYTYLVWSLLLLVLWLLVYLFSTETRRKMLKMSIGTLPLGLSEPLFYPQYWFPPTLFDLGWRTGLDVESLIFSFSVGGLASTLYEFWNRRRSQTVPACERHDRRHRFHRLALASPVIAFLLLELSTHWNPIYTASAALLAGAVCTVLCRPDLLDRVLKGGIVFTCFYFVFFYAMNQTHPNLVDLYWNNEQLSGIRIIGVPVEELLFALTFGAMWSGFYEHRHWLT